MSAAATRTRDLFREHGPAIYRFAAVLVGRQEAEDVAQETFMKLLQHLEAGRDATNLRGWLFTVAAHAARDRQRTRFRWLPWTPAHDVRVEPAALPDEDGRQQAMRDALHRLPERDRLLIALRAQGLRYHEIAAAAGINPSSVGKLLGRAIERWTRAIDTSRGDAHDVSYQRTGAGRR